jgi:hypothetical protein
MKPPDDSFFTGSLFDDPEPPPNWALTPPPAVITEDRAYARNDDPDTSHEAAASVPVTAMQETVLKTMRAHRSEYDPPGMTTSEIGRLAGLHRDSVSPRMKPLVEKEKVFNTGAKREGESGRRQIVWDLVAEREAECREN